jgi:hypothetical protein
MQMRAELVSSSANSCAPAGAALQVQAKPDKSPVRYGAAGLDLSWGMSATLAVASKFRNVAPAETDFCQILIGKHPVGSQTVLVGPVGLVTCTQSSN